MEAIVESEFAEVFVPLLMGLASYQDIFSVMKARKDGQSTNLKPFQVASESLQVRLLLCFIRYANFRTPKIGRDFGKFERAILSVFAHF